MAVFNFAGFETGDATECFSTSGTFSVQSSVKRTGNWALRVNPTTTGGGYVSFRKYSTQGQHNTNISANNVTARFYFRFATKPAASDEPIFTMTTSASAPKFELRLNSSGNLVAYNQALSLLATGTTVLAQDTWYRIEVRVGTGASATYTVRIDGVQELTGTGDLSATQNGRAYFGKVANRNGQTVDFYYDDILLNDDTSWPGAGKCLRMDPDGNGNYTAWTGTYADVDDLAAGSAAHDSDTSYISSSTSGQAETATLESAAAAGINSYDSIIGVKPYAIVRDEGGASALRLRLRSATTDNDNTVDNDPGATYATMSRVNLTDPATSAAWAVSALDSVEVGVLNNANVAARCTSMCLMVEVVDGTPPGGGLLLRGLGS